jgi:hypothetical protein
LSTDNYFISGFRAGKIEKSNNITIILSTQA